MLVISIYDDFFWGTFFLRNSPRIDDFYFISNFFFFFFIFIFIWRFLFQNRENYLLFAPKSGFGECSAKKSFLFADPSYSYDRQNTPIFPSKFKNYIIINHTGQAPLDTVFLQVASSMHSSNLVVSVSQQKSSAYHLSSTIRRLWKRPKKLV